MSNFKEGILQVIQIVARRVFPSQSTFCIIPDLAAQKVYKVKHEEVWLDYSMISSVFES